MNVQVVTHIIKQQQIHQNVKQHAYFIHQAIKRFVHQHVMEIINIQFLQQHLMNV